MTKVFIGGSRKVTNLSPQVCERLDRIVDKSFEVLVGDAPGVDTAVQTYLYEKAYMCVRVFCSSETCRNNVGDWKSEFVPTGVKSRSREFHTAKDRAMTDAADFGLMVWDGHSLGTMSNIERLVEQGKKVAVYIASKEQFTDVRSNSDLDDLWQATALDVHSEARKRKQVGKRMEERTKQANLL